MVPPLPFGIFLPHVSRSTKTFAVHKLLGKTLVLNVSFRNVRQSKVSQSSVGREIRDGFSYKGLLAVMLSNYPLRAGPA